MSNKTKTSAGNFFEDFQVGQEFRHATPRTLTEASEWLAASKAGRELFGAEFVEHFAASREWEDRLSE